MRKWHVRPLPPFMASAILNFHFDYLNLSLRQLSDLGPIKIPPLTKETKNAAKCWHLQFLEMVSYLDNIIHF